MYEPEVNNCYEIIDTLPAAVVKRFDELKPLIRFRTVLPWGEHCTECSWPTCYTTCELYDPRTDGNCRLFVDGMVRIDTKEEMRPYLLKIRFKRWGKLWTVGNLSKHNADEVWRKERNSMVVGALARLTPLPRQIKSKLLGKISYLRRCAAEEAAISAEFPDCYMMECYNPNTNPIDLTITIRERGEGSTRIFQRVIRVNPGFLREQIASHDISRQVDLTRPFEIEIVPNEVDGTVLYFGVMDFAWLTPVPNENKLSSEGAKTWKCIVWDLDNTLWSGTLIEDGHDRVTVRQEIVDVIKETDRRGILHSVASKNNSTDAMQVLQRWGLEQYFLYPQISWDPKSQSIVRIAQLLNIGVDSLAFVDDQPFEREEVRAALPQVAVVDAAHFQTILSRPECQAPITEESQQRRVMYQQDKERKVVQESFYGDYLKFLEECKIELTFSRLSGENLERVYELAQRTNQMNFSGARYPREELSRIQQSDKYDTYVIRCTDRFGSYGIVGFALVEVQVPRLLDLMFSCRIQGKRVEHAFLGHVLEKYSRPERRDFFANYKKTKKNEKPGKVFEEVGFEIAEEREGMTFLKYSSARAIQKETIVRIHLT